MTLYSAELFVVVVSPGTGSMSTLIVVGKPKRPLMSMFVNVTVFVSPALMTGIFLRSTIGLGDFWIVSVTATLNSWKSPESSTETWKARSVEAVISFWLALAPATRTFPSGSALTGPRALPWEPRRSVWVPQPWARPSELR